MLKFLKNIFQSDPLAAHASTLELINSLEAEMGQLSDAELQAAGLRLKAEAAEKEESDVPRAFALVREAAKRNLNQRPYDVQILGGLVIQAGGVAEMMTGEGKTLAAVAPAYANALLGKGVHVVTVNEYLARRDAVWMGQIYRALGLAVACLVPNGAFLYDPDWHVKPEESEKLDAVRDTTGSYLVQQEFLRPVTRREAYLADITYGTNHEFGFDYLRDNLAYRLEEQVQRGHPYAIIDEVDSILIDEARTPLIIAAADEKSSDYYRTFARIVGTFEREADYLVDEKKRSVEITQNGIEKAEKLAGVGNLYAPENLRLVHYLEESLRARALFRRDKDYVVKDDEIVIVDEFTGRMLHGRRYSGGLHQAIEAKEGVRVKEESRTYAKVSVQNYFRLYAKIAGMTGTAQTSAEEFYKVYGLETVSIPPNRPCVRADQPDAIYKNTEAKWRAVVEDIKKRHAAGQPVLVGTTSIEKNEHLAALLSRAGIPHEVLNAKNNEREGSIIAQAGRRGGVTVATNMAGRGVDIILGGNPPLAAEAEAVKASGGLHVVGTERHEARRIDNQLRGRSGRQGDPGSSQFYLSLEDDLLRIFGGDRIKSMMERFDLPEDQPIQMGMVSRAVAQAQSRVEGANFDIRKHLLEYDDVLNKQRTAVYRKRKAILESVHKGELAQIIFEASASQLDELLQQAESAESPDQKSPPDELKRILTETGVATKNWPFPDSAELGSDDLRSALRDLLTKRSVEVSANPQAAGRILSILDMLWMNHLEDLDALAESVGLRAYGQKDPLVEYREEARNLYGGFGRNFNAWVFGNIFRLEANSLSSQHAQTLAPKQSAARDPKYDKVGRNDPCPCGSGKKFKRCHGQ